MNIFLILVRTKSWENLKDMGWWTLKDQYGGRGEHYNNLLCKRGEILNNESCDKHERKTHEGDLLQSLMFSNANVAPPSPTIDN